ncbi:hypothetical protein [Halomonas elongata]|uniref:hypothetical protein n=1 Tax=Halomonas elongata TaxID=2746 RepID=UPI0023AF6DAC|nr:hypothetical protein [Halomonas elongata]
MPATTITATAIASALLVASPFTAEAAETQDHLEYCNAIGSLAEQIMTTRQSGVPMQEMIAVDPSHDLGVEMIRDAFDTNRYNTAEVQQQVITEFSNDWFAACLDATESA